MKSIKINITITLLIFCIFCHTLLIHNCEPATATATIITTAVLCPPAVPLVALGEMIFGGIVTGIGLYSVYKASKKRKKQVEFLNHLKGNSNSDNGHDPQDEDIFEAIKIKADKKLRHKRFGNFYRDPETKLWWSKDRAGHGGSVFKVFKETSKGLEWLFDADKGGYQIVGKNKGLIGCFISYKEFVVCP